MPSHISACREDHAPGERGLPSVEFTIDEISKPDEPQAYRESRTHKIGDFPEIPPASPAEEQRCEHDANESPVERHSTLPDVKDFNRPLDVAGEIVEENVADPAPDHHPQNQKEEQVVEIVGRQRQLFQLHKTLEKEIPGDERDHVHQPVPSELHGADLQEHRTDVGKLKLQHH